VAPAAHRGNGIGRIGAEYHELQIDSDLRRSETRAVDCVHGLGHVGDELVNVVGIEFAHRLRHAQQARVAHFQDFTNGHATKHTGAAKA
jgi:hypothetical protein